MNFEKTENKLNIHLYLLITLTGNNKETAYMNLILIASIYK